MLGISTDNNKRGKSGKEETRVDREGRKNTVKQPAGGGEITRVSEIRGGGGGGWKKIDHLHSFNCVKSKNKKSTIKHAENTHSMQKKNETVRTSFLLF